MCTTVQLYYLSLGEYILSKFEINILKSETRTKLLYTKYTLPLYTEYARYHTLLFVCFLFSNFFYYFRFSFSFDEMRKEGEEKYKSAIVMFRFILIAVALPLAVANNLRTTPHAAAVTEAKATVVTNDHIHTMNVCYKFDLKAKKNTSHSPSSYTLPYFFLRLVFFLLFLSSSTPCF